LTYEERTAGGMMTTEPVVLRPMPTLAEALARVREPEIIPRSPHFALRMPTPLETPTGRFLGVVGTSSAVARTASTLVARSSNQ